MNADPSGLRAEWHGHHLHFLADPGYSGTAFAHTVTPNWDGHYALPNMWPWETWDGDREQTSTQHAYAQGATGQLVPEGAANDDVAAWQRGRADVLTLRTRATDLPRPGTGGLGESLSKGFGVLFGSDLDGTPLITVHPRAAHAVPVLLRHHMIPAATALTFTTPTNTRDDVVADAYGALIEAGTHAVYLMNTPLLGGQFQHDVRFQHTPHGLIAATVLDPVVRETLLQCAFREVDVNHSWRERTYLLPRDIGQPLAAVERAYTSLLARGRSVAVRNLLADPLVPATAPPSILGVPRPVPQPAGIPAVRR
ncbi:hypothetical protein ACIO3O_08525 [Streptomyces sp. NPDC087440]|uniref:hypothetical protein n=1 Tax=Streptomyces sp. NPDC087440 TaxID=3365790 RepID=UPI0038070E37